MSTAHRIAVLLGVIALLTATAVLIRGTGAGPMASNETSVTENQRTASRNAVSEQDAKQTRFSRIDSGNGAKASNSSHVAEVNARQYGSIERSMLDDGMINETAIRSLQGRGFDAFVTRFEAENSDTGEITAAYRAEFDQQLQHTADAGRLLRLACGVDLCVGSIHVPKAAAGFDRWYASLQSTDRYPVFALTQAVIDQGDAREHRIMFSTSPAANGFTGSFSPPRH